MPEDICTASTSFTRHDVGPIDSIGKVESQARSRVSHIGFKTGRKSDRTNTVCIRPSDFLAFMFGTRITRPEHWLMTPVANCPTYAVPPCDCVGRSSGIAYRIRLSVCECKCRSTAIELSRLRNEYSLTIP